MGFTFLATLLTLRYFLELYPEETVIILVRNETNSDASTFMRAFQADIAAFPSTLFFNAKERSMRDIALSEVRGKIVLLGYQANLGPEWASTTTFFGPPEAWMTELKWNYFPFNYPTKIANCQKIMRHARSRSLAEGIRSSYMVAWNQSILGIINPIVAATRLATHIQALYTAENCGKGGEYRFGIVHFDFYELFQEQVEHIVRSNEGCSDL